MERLRVDAVGWAADDSGTWLKLRTPKAREVAQGLMRDKDYDVTLKVHREKRSLDQNALYWKCLNELAKAVQAPVSLLHNVMLRDYGELERYGGKLVYVVLPDTLEASEQADHAETYHLKPTAETRVGKDGAAWRTWLLLRGSSTYNTKEMSRLIDGVLDECKQAGIEVLSDYERALLQNIELRTKGK